MKKLLIVFHRIDFDGLCSMSVVRHWAESNGLKVYLLGYTYGDNDPVIDADYDMVFVVDLRLPTGLMVSLNRNGKLVWIDHHATSIADSYEFGFADAPGLRREGVGACELCWEFLNHGDTPKLIQLLSTYDVWDKVRFNWNKETLPFQFGMRNAFNLEPDEFYAFYLSVVAENDLLLMDYIFDDGKAILNYVRVTGKRACDAYAFEVTIADGTLSGLCMLTPHFGCLEFEESLRQRGCQVAVCVNRHAASGTYKVSMYAGGSDLGEFNIGAYMKEHYNGGGHRSAAGGTLTEEQFLRLLNEHCL